MTNDLFAVLDEALDQPHKVKHLMLLADSGMGKTTALLNYYARHLRAWRKPDYKVALLTFSSADVDHRIVKLLDKHSTILFLDALNEDIQLSEVNAEE